MKIILTLTFIAFNFCSFCQTGATNEKISFTKNKYEIQYPKSWRLDTSGMMGTELIIFSPLEDETDKFSENVNVVIQNLGGQNIDLEKYKEITDKQLEDMATDSKVFESVIVETHNDNYFKVVYAMTHGKFRLKISSVCFIKNNKAYLATCTSEIDKYDSYKKVGEEILSSFILKD